MNFIPLQQGLPFFIKKNPPQMQGVFDLSDYFQEGKEPREGVVSPKRNL